MIDGNTVKLNGDGMTIDTSNISNEDIMELITRRRRQILVHSCIYYRLNTNIIDDHKYDLWSKQLADLQERFPELSKEAPLYEYYAEFDGSTGFDLPVNHPDVIHSARKVLEYYNKLKS